MMMEKSELKQTLLSYNIFIDNKYLDLYIDMVFLNTSTCYLKYQTQKHHVIPISYYKHYYKEKELSRYQYAKIAEKDINNFVINVLYKDHLLLHYYLMLCSKFKWFRYANFNMISFLPESFDKCLKENLLDEYQNIYQDMIKYQTSAYNKNRRQGLLNYYKNLTPEQRELRKASLRGRTCPKRIISDKTRKKLSKSLMNHPVSEKTRNKISETRNSKDLTMISKDNLIKFVPKENITEYLNSGWLIGSKACERKIAIRNNITSKRIPISQLDKYLSEGYTFGHNHITSQSLKGKKVVNNGTIQKHIDEKELDAYLAQGWKKGYLEHRKTHSRGVIQFTLDNKEIARYQSVSAANIAVGLAKNATAINACCKGKQKTSMGYIWKYIEEE